MSGFFAGETPSYTTLEQEALETIPRDRWDRPLIWPQGTGPETHDKKTMLPYARASSYGGQLEDKSALERWGKRQMLRGAAIDVDRYRADIAAAGDNRRDVAPTIVDLVPQGPARERSGEIDFRDKKTLDRLVDRADEAVGSQDKAALGTDIHYATELIDQGESLDGLSPFLRERANAYYSAITDWGLSYTSIEQFGVEDENQVAGTWDRCGFVPFWGTDKQRILDVKTSGTMDFAGIGFAVQLATYAHSQAYDPVTGGRTPHESMDLERALIIHVSREEKGPVEMFEVNIAVGWEYAQLARQVIIARREGRKAISAITELEATILTAASEEELLSLWSESGNVWGRREKEAATMRRVQLLG